MEDDAGMRRLITRTLQDDGFRVSGARDGQEMWETLERLPIDLVLLDVMLPGTTGMDLCRMLRARSTIPIIIVTARASETDRVLGLELGADDYLPKPFSGPELVARIRAVLRRSRMTVTEPSVPRGRRLRFAGWTLDLARRELANPDGAAVDLSGAEYDTLLAFLEHPHRVLSRDQLLELSRKRLGEVFDRSVDVLVSRLRKKIEPEPGEQTMIKTVRGTGYMFVPDVTQP
ncbi:MAG: response regulator transcription factor [Acetobacteraceae bacterium]